MKVMWRFLTIFAASIALLLPTGGFSVHFPGSQATPNLNPPTDDSGGQRPDKARQEDRILELVHQVGGSAKAVAVQGSIAYVGFDRQLAFIDIANAAQPASIGLTAILPAVVQDVAVAGDFAYVALGRKGFGVIHTADLEDPRLVGIFDTPGHTSEIVLQDQFAYLADGSDSGLRIFDASNPLAPKLAAYYVLAYPPDQIAIFGDYVYLANSHSSEAPVSIIDIHNPAQPRLAGSIVGEYLKRDIAVTGNYAYIAEPGGMEIFDVSDPARARRVGGWYVGGADDFGPGTSLAVAGHYVYVGTTTCVQDGECSSFTTILDVAKPDDPRVVGSKAGLFHDLVISGDYAFGTIDGNFQTFDRTNPAELVQVGEYLPAAPFIKTIAGGIAYANKGQRMELFSLTDPLMLERAGVYEASGDIRRTAAASSYAYLLVADENQTEPVCALEIVDVSHPQHPSQVSVLQGLPDCYSLAVTADHVFILVEIEQENWNTRGVQNIDVSNPYQPRFLEFLETSPSSVQVIAQGNFIYTADGEDGFSIIELIDPTHFGPIYHYVEEYLIYQMAVTGNYAYVAVQEQAPYPLPLPDGSAGSSALFWEAGEPGLSVIDLSNPADPQKIYTGPLFSAYPTAMQIAGDFLFVAGGWENGISVLDISDPTAPRQAATHDLDRLPRNSVVDGEYIYASGLECLYVLRWWSPNEQPTYLPGLLRDFANCEESVTKAKTWEGYFSWQCDRANKVDGEVSLQLKTEEVTEAELYSPLIPVHPERLYQISYWVKTNLVTDHTGVYGRIIPAQYNNQAAESDQLDENRIDSGFSLGENVGGTTSWAHKSYYFRTTAETSYLRLQAPLGLAGRARGQVWYDQISLTQK